MTDMLRPVLETLVVIPGMLIAYVQFEPFFNIVGTKHLKMAQIAHIFPSTGCMCQLIACGCKLLNTEIFH